MSTSLLEPYVPTLVTDPRRPTWVLDGSMVFPDVSGFPKLSEKLAEQGKAGAEELTDILLGTFTDLLGEARDEGGDLLKYGGDALFLAFDGPGQQIGMPVVDAVADLVVTAQPMRAGGVGVGRRRRRDCRCHQGSGRGRGLCRR